MNQNVQIDSVILVTEGEKITTKFQLTW